MSNPKQKILRSSALGARPAAATREAGELYVNFPDRQLGVINVAEDAQDLIGVRNFSETAAYVVGDLVVREADNEMYRAILPNGPGPFITTDWEIGRNVWPTTFGGYGPTGLHEEYVGVADNVLINSRFYVTDTGLVGGPVDFTTTGFMLTSMGTNNTFGTQRLDGLSGIDNGKVWIRERVGAIWQAWKLLLGGNAGGIGELVYLPGVRDVPVGTGLIEADGTELNRVAFSQLWSFVIANAILITDATWLANSNGGANGVGQYSDGDGAGTFRIPDFRGEFLRGMNKIVGGSPGDTTRDPDRADESFDWQDSEFESHRHTDIGTLNGDSDGLTDGQGFNGSHNTGFAGGSESRGRNLPVLVCIRAEL